MKKIATFAIVMFFVLMSFNVFAANLPVNEPPLYCKALGPHTMELSWRWQKNGKPLPTKLELFRKTPGSGTFKYLKDCPISRTSTKTQDTGLQPDTKYMYKLKVWLQDGVTNHHQWSNETHCRTGPEPGDTSVRCDCGVTNVTPGTKVHFEVTITTDYKVKKVVMHFDNGSTQTNQTGSKKITFKGIYDQVGTYSPWVEVTTDKPEKKIKQCCTITVEQKEKPDCYMILEMYRAEVMSKVIDGETKYFVRHDVIPGNYNPDGKFQLYKAVYSLEPVEGDELGRNEIQIYGLYKPFEQVGNAVDGDKDFSYDDYDIKEGTLTIYIWKWMCGDCEREWIDFGGYHLRYSKGIIMIWPLMDRYYWWE